MSVKARLKTLDSLIASAIAELQALDQEIGELDQSVDAIAKSREILVELQDYREVLKEKTPK